MAIRTTVDIPEHLHETLRLKAQESGSSIRSLIVHALDVAYEEDNKGKYLTGPIITGTGKRGPAYTTGENPHDFVFPDLAIAW